jgi:putative transposase
LKSNESYHTELNCLARENLLSREIAVLIPRTNIWRWKNEPADKYKTFELNLRGAQDYDIIRSFAQDRKAKRIFTAYVRLSKFFVTLAQSVPKFHKHVHNMRIQVVKTIDRIRGSLGLTNVLRAFNISVSTFRQWSMETFTSCFHSIVNKCNRIYPTQLSSPEIAALKEKLLSPQYQYWPISSIALDCLRNGTLPLALNTWYKYSKRLGIQMLKSKDRRKKQAEGIRAARPNQIWHADITRFVTLDNQVHYIYLVVDNFSRKILSWFVASKVSALIRRLTIGEALKSFIGSEEPIVIITDGGPENSLKEYLDSFSVPVTHQKALLDIQCSNSLIEAHNKVIKYNYLYKMTLADDGELKRAMDWICNDFNNRPHISLNGLTPNEHHAKASLDVNSLKEKKKAAAEDRKLFNYKNRCVGCAA